MRKGTTWQPKCVRILVCPLKAEDFSFSFADFKKRTLTYDGGFFPFKMSQIVRTSKAAVKALGFTGL